MKRLIHLTIVLTILIITQVISVPVDGNGDQGGCSCAVFPEDSNSLPLIEQPLQYNVSCDAEGSEICQNLCVALAQGAREQAPALICEKLNKQVENLKVAVFTKTSCSNIKNEWKFTGLKSPDPICCDGGKETVCNV